MSCSQLGLGEPGWLAEVKNVTLFKEGVKGSPEFALARGCFNGRDSVALGIPLSPGYGCICL